MFSEPKLASENLGLYTGQYGIPLQLMKTSILNNTADAHVRRRYARPTQIRTSDADTHVRHGCALDDGFPILII